MSDNLDALDDCQLIARFCVGDKTAGDCLCIRHQHKLLAFIQHILRARSLDTGLAGDIFQEVWLAMMSADHYRLKHYTRGRAPFEAYLRKIALRIILNRFPGTARRRKREIPQDLADLLDPASDDPLVMAELAEYLEHLSHQESRCLHEKLLNEPKPEGEPPISAINERVLKHRLQQKLKHYLDIP